MWPLPSVRALSEHLERLPVGDVEWIARDLAELGEARNGGLENRDIAVADDDSGAAVQKSFCGGMPNAAGGPGDRDGPAPDVVHAAKLYTCQVLTRTPSGNADGRAAVDSEVMTLPTEDGLRFVTVGQHDALAEPLLVELALEYSTDTAARPSG